MSKASNGYKKFIQKTKYEALGKEKGNVAVLGAFDTWSYMHEVCVEVAKLGYAAITSRYIYVKSSDTKSKYFRTARDEVQKTMNDFLKQDVIGISNKALIIYSVPAAHYNEADWCYQKIKEDSNFKTLGICFVRDIYKKEQCRSCVINDELNYAYCEGEGSAWGCINKPDCPFKNQGIAKNQIEYFLANKSNMFLIAVEKIDKIRDILNTFLEDKFIIPKNCPYVFEFRIDLKNDDKDKLENIVNSLLHNLEEKKEETYEYIDYYYKPKHQSVNDWIKKKRTLRIRESKIPLNEQETNADSASTHGITSIYSSELIQTNKGFFCNDPFGNLKWYQGEKEKSEKLLNEHDMDFFIKVIKSGKNYTINHGGLAFRLFIEDIQVETGNNKSIDYGNSVEIEIWSEKPEYTCELEKIKEAILKLLQIDKLPIQTVPVQEFIYEWSKKQTFITNE
jgi:hypothetical protein